METYLAHDGILGMKWGVRRYQNPDGTLANAGKKRYADFSDAYREKSKKAAKTAGKAAAAGAIVKLASDSAARTAKDLVQVAKRKSDFTSNTAEAINRLTDFEDMALGSSDRGPLHVTNYERFKNAYNNDVKLAENASSLASKYADVARGAMSVASIISNVGAVAVIGSAVISAGQLAYSAYLKHQAKKALEANKES